MMRDAGILALICIAALFSVGHCTDVDRKGVRGANVDRELQSNTVVFNLINAVTDTVMTTLAPGSVVYLGTVLPRSLSIQVVVKGFVRRSVKIMLSGATSITRTESGTYALCGNAGTDFAPCPTMVLGGYTVKAELYSGSGATGSLVTTSELSFSLTNTTVPTAPVTAPVVAPVAPVAAPVAAPIAAPVVAPVVAPSPSTCTVPKLVGSWEQWEKYPLNVAESMGGLIGDDFAVISGFAGAWTKVTKSVYAYNTRDPLAKWRKMDDVPVTGFTHAAFATVGQVMYICGAYVGGTPGPDSKICLKYDHSVAPGSGKQWSFLPELPAGRGGSGMNHIKETNSLVFSIGATRRSTTVDYATTWELSLDNLAAGWVARPDCLYKGNHVSHVTAYYKGKPHYYWAGGQIEQKEDDGNQNDLVEWDQATKNWIRRADMPLSRGHASSSTIPYGCGFLMIGGAVNTGTKTTDISWYNIETDKWYKVGDLKNKINTPVCDVVKNLNGSDWIYCQTGSVSGDYTWKSKITL